MRESPTLDRRKFLTVTGAAAGTIAGIASVGIYHVLTKESETNKTASAEGKKKISEGLNTIKQSVAALLASFGLGAGSIGGNLLGEYLDSLADDKSHPTKSTSLRDSENFEGIH
ncbi:MAG: hypothetical protein KBA40_01545 [Candidatus Peribacteraceae bacterium]|nr:hypothetical protein [Candidatus Peribacteraceae bacterium]